jgi:hypothetical protein
MGYGLGLIPGKGKRFFYSVSYKMATGALSLRVKMLGCEAD